MSDLPIVPSEEDSSSQVPKDPKYKKPEFIIIDDTQDYLKNSPFSKMGNYQSEARESEDIPLTRNRAVSNPFSLRFWCLLGMIFCLFFGMGMLILFVSFSVVATLLLFQSHTFNSSVKSFGRILYQTFIALIGFTLGIISPTLGLSLLILYFSLKNEVINNSLWKTILRNTFNKL